MHVPVKNPRLFVRISAYFATAIRGILNLLVIVAISALFIGVLKTGYDMLGALHQPAREMLERILVDFVFILALVEITITILGYLKDGRVHVHYIVDMVLIIMLHEVVSLWFAKPAFPQVAGIMLIIGTLAIVRVLVTRFSPPSTID